MLREQMKKKSFTFISMLLVLNFSAQAQQAPSSLSMSVTQPKKTSPFHITANLQQSSNQFNDDRGGREASTALDLIPSVELTSSITLGARSIITQEYTQGRDTKLSNTQLNLGIKGPKFTDKLESSFLVRGVAPTSEESQKRDRYQGGAGLGATLAWTNKVVLLAYSAIGSRNFHEYNINAEGSPNIQYSFNQELKFGVEFIPKWSFSSSYIYKNGWTYRDFARQTYAYSAEIGYDITKSWNVAVGTELNADVFKPNGTDSNLKFYDENTSTVYVGVTFTN
jgi:hypothetical protein